MKKLNKLTAGLLCSTLLANVNMVVANHLMNTPVSLSAMTASSVSSIHEISKAELLTTMQYQQPMTSGQQVIKQTVLSYDKQGKRIDQEKPVVSFTTQDSFTGNTLSTLDADGNSTEKTYDALARNTSIDYKNAQGIRQEIIAYRQNNAGHAVKKYFPDGTTKTIQVNELGQTVAVYASQHGTTPVETFAYTDLGQQYQTTTIEGIQTTKKFDAQGQEVSRTIGMQGQPVQLTHETRYDVVLNKMETYSHGSDGSDGSVTGKVEKYNDDNGQWVQSIENPSAVEGMGLADSAAKPIQQFSTHDNFGQTVLLNAARDTRSRRLMHYRHDAQGHVTRAVIDAAEKKDTYLRINFAYLNLAGKLSRKTLQVLHADGSVAESMTRNEKNVSPTGKLLSIHLLGDESRDNGVSKSMDYDAVGNKISLHDWHRSPQAHGGTDTINYTYTNILGKEKLTAEQIPAHGRYPAYTLYTKINQNTGEVTDTYKISRFGSKKINRIHYSYDDPEHPHWLTKKTEDYGSAHQQTITYDYYPISGRLKTVTNPLGYITQYVYGDDKNPAILKSQLTKLVIYQPDGVTALAEVDYHYDSLQRLLTKSRFHRIDNQLVNADSYTYSYDRFGNMADIDHQLSDQQLGSKLEHIHYDWDQQGYITHEIYSQGDATNYREITSRYDNLHRLIESDKVEHQDGLQKATAISYVLDVNDNMQQKTVSASPTTMTDVSWDAEQRNLKLTYNGLDQAQIHNANGYGVHYDPNNGDLLRDDRGVRYQRDGLHKIRQLTDSRGKLLARYAYGSDGMRRIKSDDKTRLRYVYQGRALLTTTDNHGNAAFYLRGHGREARLLLKAGQTQPSIRFYGYDNQSVSHTVDIDSQGQMVGQAYHHYSDYGQVLDNSDKKAGRVLSITYDPYSAGGFGEYAEQETQGRLQYRPAREYVVSLHQFASLDTDNRFNNRYTYGEGNPRMKFDPSGNSVVTALAMIGQIVGTGVLGLAKLAYSQNMLVSGLLDVGMIGVACIPYYKAIGEKNNPHRARAVLNAVAIAAGGAVGLATGMVVRGLSAALIEGEINCVDRCFLAAVRVAAIPASAVLGAIAARAADVDIFNRFPNLAGMDAIRDEGKAAYEKILHSAVFLGGVMGAAVSLEQWGGGSGEGDGLVRDPSDYSVLSRFAQLPSSLDEELTSEESICGKGNRNNYHET